MLSINKKIILNNLYICLLLCILSLFLLAWVYYFPIPCPIKDSLIHFAHNLIDIFKNLGTNFKKFIFIKPADGVVFMFWFSGIVPFLYFILPLIFAIINHTNRHIIIILDIIVLIHFGFLITLMISFIKTVAVITLLPLFLVIIFLRIYQYKKKLIFIE